MIRKFLFLALVLLFLLHNDVWYWNDARLVAGVPVGLVYHILFCVGSALIMGALVRYAWPAGLDEEKD